LFYLLVSVRDGFGGVIRLQNALAVEY